MAKKKKKKIIKKKRVASIKRKTKETDISIQMNLDGSGKYSIKTPEPFLTHMLEQLSKHSRIDIKMTAKGDTEIDSHHLTEDAGIVIGLALVKALGNKKGIKRFGYAVVPMDCSLAFAAVDLVKRPYFKINLKLRGKKIEGMPTEDINHFLESFSTSLCANIHIFVQYGSNDHHKTEAAVKAFALALRQALSIDRRRKGVPSSKGVI